VFVTLHTSQEIFGRSTLTDALVIAPAVQDVPSVVGALREAFRLESGVFITEHYSQFRRKVHDFAQTLALFTIIAAATAALAGSFAANLMHDVYADRRRQYATLLALGFSPANTAMIGIGVGIAVASAATALAGCGKSRDFGKTVMKRARNGSPGLIKSTGYEGAKGDESGWKHHRPTFSAAC
jgi:hypothetical protein